MKRLLLGWFALVLAGTLVATSSRMEAIFSDVVEVPENAVVADVRSRPLVELFSPNGGEIIYFGDEVVVQWRAVDPDGLRLRVSLWVSQDGVEWKRVVKRAKNTGFYRWRPRKLSPGSYLLKVVAVARRDPWRVVGEDVSDGFWELREDD